MKKASDVFKSIRFAKAEPRGKPHSSTDEEGHYAVGEKEFNQQLKHVKKMAMQEEKKDVYDEGEYDREGDMAKSDLRSIIANAKRLHDMIGDADNLPEWVQSKITVAEDYISTVANYMTAEVNEEVQYIEEKNAPTNPDLWSRAKALAKSKFDVYPSAYANGWAAKWYKSKGGGWKTVSEEVEQFDEAYGMNLIKTTAKHPDDNWHHIEKLKKAGIPASQGAGGSGHIIVNVKYHEKAKSLLSGHLKEEVENLEELSKTTLGSYVKKAAFDMGQKGISVGQSDSKSKWAPITKKMNKRTDSIIKATDRLTKEEIEQLEEMPGANMDTRAVHAHLKKKGWSLSRTSGSHDVYTHPDAEHHIAVPRHRQLKAPLVKGILKQSIVNEDIDDQIIEDAIAFLKEGRPSQQHPLEGHDYHKKTDAELRYIAKDAHEAAEAMKSHNTQAENKYRDQANDSATVRYWRQKHGMPDWYKKKYGHMKEEVEHIEEAKDDVPFDGPYKKKTAVATDKSGAKHTGMSRAKHLAKLAMKKQSDGLKKPRLEEEKDEEMSPKTKIVRDVVKNSKKKNAESGAKDKFESDPELTSQIVKT